MIRTCLITFPLFSPPRPPKDVGFDSEQESRRGGHYPTAGMFHVLVLFLRSLLIRYIMMVF